MSFSFDLDTNRRIAYFTGQGCCDYVDFCVALNGLLNHPLYQPGMALVWDWQRCEILLANTQIRSLVDTLTRSSSGDQTSRMAIITCLGTHSSAIAFQKYVEGMAPQWRVLLFSGIDQASAWIGTASGKDASAAGSELMPSPGSKAFFKTPIQRGGGHWTSF